MICHHGIRREHRYGTVAADISVCFLTYDILDNTNLVKWWQCGRPGPRQTAKIKVEEDEFALMKQLIKLLAGRSKDAECWELPLKRAALPAELQSLFVRVLVPPLFAPGSVRAREMSIMMAHHESRGQV